MFTTEVSCINREDIPQEAVEACTTQGSCTQAVTYWVNRLGFKADAEAVRSSLEATGAWETDELVDDAVNLQRIFWLACWDFREGAEAFYIYG